MRRADPHHDTRFGPTQTIVAPDFFDPDGGILDIVFADRRYPQQADAGRVYGQSWP